MKCDKVRAELSAHLDGEISAALRAEMDAHLAGCASCRREWEQLQRVTAGVAALPQLAPTPEFLQEVRRKLSAGEVPDEQRGPAWVDALFRPVWLKVPLEALALVAVTATIVMMQKPRPAAVVTVAKASPVKVVTEPVVATKQEAPALVVPPAPAPVVAEAVTPEPPVVEEHEEVVAVAPAKPESAVDRLTPAEVVLKKDTPHELPASPQMALAVPPPVVSAPAESVANVISSLDKPVAPPRADEVADAKVSTPVADGQVIIAPIVIVHAGDFTKMRRQVETAAVQMGGQILSRTESQLTGKGGVVYTFQVQLPRGQVPAFRSQFANANTGEQTRSLMGTPPVLQGELPAPATSTTARAAVGYAEPAGREKEQTVVVEVQVMPAE